MQQQDVPLQAQTLPASKSSRREEELPRMLQNQHAVLRTKMTKTSVMSKNKEVEDDDILRRMRKNKEVDDDILLPMMSKNDEEDDDDIVQLIQQQSASNYALQSVEGIVQLLFKTSHGGN